MFEEARDPVEPREIPLKRKQGAPLGNQNARKHGFYSGVLTRAERYRLDKAVGVRGVDTEIALLRVKLRSVIENDPGNVPLIVQAVTALAKLTVAGKGVKSDDRDLKQVLLDIIGEYALPIAAELGKAPEK